MYMRERKQMCGPMGTKPRFFSLRACARDQKSRFCNYLGQESPLLVVFKVNEIYFGNQGADDPSV